MNYVEAIDAPSLRDGVIKLHGPEGFEGMRKAELRYKKLCSFAPWNP